MSKPPVESVRSLMKPIAGSGREKLGDPLITVDPKNLHARTRLPAIFSMATHSTLAKYFGKEKTVYNNQGVKFDMSTPEGVMDYWQFEYEAMAPSLDGKSRDEYVKVASFVAIGQDDSGALTSNLLEEGNKKLSQKDKK